MRTLIGSLFLAIFLAACAKAPAPPIEDLSKAQDLSRFQLTRLMGTRDGDSLAARALYSDATGDEVRVDLRFKVGVPTHLVSGTWRGLGGEGTVAERSVTFLGGQSAAPSLGGRFNLVGSDGVARYTITIPLQPLTHPY